jgi:Protein of unknown function (DUF2934)
MNGNPEAQVHSPEEILRKVDQTDDGSKQVIWKVLSGASYYELTSLFAGFLWELQGKIVGRDSDYWIAAEKVTAAWSDAIRKTTWWPSISFR